MRPVCEATVQLQHALEECLRVAVLVRSSETQARVIEGVPVEFRMARDGRERVVLHVHAELSQLVVLDRIAWVAPAREERATTTPVPAPRRSVLADTLAPRRMAPPKAPPMPPRDPSLVGSVYRIPAGAYARVVRS